MNGKFLFGMVSGVALVAAAFVLGSALFPVEAARPKVATIPEASEDPAAGSAGVTAPKATDAEAGVAADVQPEADAETSPETAPETANATEAEPPADQDAEMPADAAATEAAAEPAPAAQAAAETEPAQTLPAKMADKAAETAATAVTEAADATVAAVETKAEAPSSDPSPSTEPSPQETDAAQPPDVAPALAELPKAAASGEEAGVAPDVPSTAQPAALPTLPSLAQLDDKAVIAALDKAAMEQVATAPPALQDEAATAVLPSTEATPEEAPAAEPPAADVPAMEPQPPATESPAAPEAEPPAAETPATETPANEAPAAEEPEAPAAETPAPPDAMADSGEDAPSSQPGTDTPEMPGTRPEALPSSEEPAPEPEVATLTEDEGSGSTFKPAPGLGTESEGVIVGRLPRIGTAPADEGVLPEATEASPEDDARPIVQFAAAFENPDGKPAVAIVLIDPGTADLDRDGLANLPFPISVALDPMDPATPERAAIYRAAGKEVVMLATGIAEGAQASDIEVAFQSMAQVLPEAVAVMDLSEPTFQNRRPLASIVVPVVGAQGRGLLTWDEGLNAADQVARREDIPSAVVFRDLTSGGSDGAAIRRVLDRAIFKAGQDGRVVVAGTASPETVAALLEWSVEGRAATVALAPLTAVLAVE